MSLSPLSWPMSKKIPAMIIFIGLLVAGITGAFSYYSAKTALKFESNSKLTAILDNRYEALKFWLKGIEGDLVTQSGNPTIRAALTEFSSAWKELGGDQTKKLHSLYITENPHPTGKKEELDAAPDGSQYSVVHAKYYPYLRSFLRDRGYYDIFLFYLEGNLIYTVFKELDYATNLLQGKWAKTDLGNAFRAALNSKKGDKTFFDFK